MGGNGVQDRYVGDIGDYGKYGLLREVTAAGLSLSVNWYKVDEAGSGKQDDGKYISYLSLPDIYREYDAELFDTLREIVCVENDRRIERVETAGLFPSSFFSDEIDCDRSYWHSKALAETKDAEVVFLDPDNGLETLNMNRMGGATGKHVKWSELNDYYVRGQNVILYHHRPQRTSKERCIEGVMAFQREYLKADRVMLLEFPKYTNRFYFIFMHAEYVAVFRKICGIMVQKWSKNGFCREIILDIQGVSETKH